jgi:hypothetical protein
MSKQRYQHDDHDEQPNESVTTSAIIAASVTPVAASAAEQEHENDNQKDKFHCLLQNRRLFARHLAPSSQSNPYANAWSAPRFPPAAKIEFKLRRLPKSFEPALLIWALTGAPFYSGRIE